jgi:hypothetical protein
LVAAQSTPPPGHLRPVELTQAPPTHVSPPGQALPQAPQLAFEFDKATHCPLHEVCPAGQVQVPPTHWKPAPHVVVQLPQWLLSMLVAVQKPPQSIWPDGHVQAPL